MKKPFFLFAALLMSFGLCAAERGVINADILNLRQEPDFKSPVVGKCVRGDEVTILRVTGNWAELELPAKLPVYVAESRLQHGKTISEVNLRAKPAASAPSFGMLRAGSEVKVLQQEKFGWVRIAPPTGFKVYTAKMYLSFDEKKLAAESASAVTPSEEKKPEPAAPEKKLVPPAVPEAAAPAVKPVEAVKPAAPAAKTAAPAVKPAAPAVKPVAPAVKPVAPAVKPVAPAVKPVAPAVKPAAPAAKPVAPAVKPVEAVKPAASAAVLEAPWNTAFGQLGIDLKKAPSAVSLKGMLTKLNFSQNPATDYALLEGKNGKNLAFVCSKDGAALKSLEGKNVVVSGDAYQLPGGTAPVILLTSVKAE